MDDEIQHLGKINAILKISLVVLGLLVLLGVIQAVTVGTVGIGALSIDLRDAASQPPPATSSGSSNGLSGALDTTTAGTSETPRTPSAKAKVVSGSFKQSRGLLTVEVTKVENQGGRVRLFITAVNASTAKMELPLGPFKVVDDQKHEYGASLATSQWPVTIAKGAEISGAIDLDQAVGDAAKTIDIAFNGIIGTFAPTGGAIAVAEIEIPR